ncbi:protein SPMIP1 [Ptiloglossa arizonensis]|uniref:protein SPMIP1 n=1 Tax=Ptiloglossa arizonensis TaxID=3350558 RepID=UPI003FA0757B
MDVMKPMHPQVKNLLYEDAPSFINAENYMNKRFKDIPEDRYYFPDCTSWIYGWRLSDYPPIPRSKVGKTNVTVNEFYRWRISSLQRDPEWYRPCQRTSSRCDDDVN